MSKPIISFDLDGVVFGGGYLSKEDQDRDPSIYSRLPLKEPGVPYVLNNLMDAFNIYFLSSRSFPGALEVSRKALAEAGVEMERVCGVVCGRKMKALHALASELHVDDDPVVIARLRQSADWDPLREHALHALLFNNPDWPANQALTLPPWGRVDCWTCLCSKIAIRLGWPEAGDVLQAIGGDQR